MSNMTCSGCGTALDDPENLNWEERKPCPTCGSMNRTAQLYGRITMVTSARASLSTISSDVQSITAISELLMGAVVVAGDTRTEGRLIEAIAIPWFDIVDLLKKDPRIAFQIPPYRWEEIVAGSYRKAGFDEVILTPRSGDGGRDVIATIRAIGSVRVIDQVKAYAPGHLVTADHARALYGVLMLDGAAKGFLTTTSDFAPLLTKDPLLGPIIPSRIELINGKALLARLEELARKRRS